VDELSKDAFDRSTSINYLFDPRLGEDTFLETEDRLAGPCKASWVCRKREDRPDRGDPLNRVKVRYRYATQPVVGGIINYNRVQMTG
jgi:hypothetical protein